MNNFRNEKGQFTQLTCESWLSGKHSDDIEINTSLPYVSIKDYFVQDSEANNTIHEINIIYNMDNCSVLDACLKWYSLYF